MVQIVVAHGSMRQRNGSGSHARHGHGRHGEQLRLSGRHGHLDADGSAAGVLDWRAIGLALLQVAAALASGVLIILGDGDSAVAWLVCNMLGSAAVSAFLTRALHLAIQGLGHRAIRVRQVAAALVQQEAGVGRVTHVQAVHAGDR